MLTATLLLLGVVLLGMCLLELHVTRLPLSPAIVYLAVGWVAGWMASAHVRTPPTAPERADMLVVITEVAVLISLFAVGLQLRMPWTLKGWRVAAVLASVTMVVTIALATLAGWWLMPGLGFAGALLLAGILAPTDPVLASEVQIRSRIDRDAGRVALTAEGGLNDGTALPVVLLALGLLGVGELGPHGMRWLWHDLAWPIAGGALLGWAFGRGLGRLIHHLMRKGHGLGWDELLYLGIITVASGCRCSPPRPRSCSCSRRPWGCSVERHAPGRRSRRGSSNTTSCPIACSRSDTAAAGSSRWRWCWRWGSRCPGCSGAASRSATPRCCWWSSGR